MTPTGPFARLPGVALAAIAAVALPFMVGCYTYTETSLDALSPGTQTRVLLDEEGFGRVVNQAAVNGVPMENLDLGGRGISGRLMSLDPATMMMEMRGAGGSVFSADIPTHAIQQVAIRGFSRRRTVLAVAVGVALGGSILSGTVGGTTSGPPGEDPDNMVVPLFSIPFH